MSRSTLCTLGIGYVTVVASIVVIDWWLGSTAEYLNGYELVRRSFARAWPEASRQFLWRQDLFGRWALTLGWVALLVEALAAEALLYAAWALAKARCG